MTSAGSQGSQCRLSGMASADSLTGMASAGSLTGMPVQALRVGNRCHSFLPRAEKGYGKPGFPMSRELVQIFL